MLLTADAGPGGLGALILVVFFVAAVVIFIAMSRSLRRMRGNVNRGKFGDPDDGSTTGAAPGEEGPGEAGRRGGGPAR